MSVYLPARTWCGTAGLQQKRCNVGWLYGSKRRMPEEYMLQCVACQMEVGRQRLHQLILSVCPEKLQQAIDAEGLLCMQSRSLETVMMNRRSALDLDCVSDVLCDDPHFVPFQPNETADSGSEVLLPLRPDMRRSQAPS